MTYIILKYLKLTSGGRSVTAMSMIAVIGIALGVATLTVSLSIAKGFGTAYREGILKGSAPVVLLSATEIENASAVLEKLKNSHQEEITSLTPFIYREGLLIYKGQVRGVVFKGVGGASLGALTARVAAPPKGRDIILGQDLADELKVAVGDSVRVMLPEQFAKQSFTTLTVGGFFESGMYDIDSQFVLMDLSQAQTIFRMPDTLSGVEIGIADWRTSLPFARKIEKEFPYPLYAAGWEELNRSLLEAVRLEQVMFVIIMGAFVVVASFNIIAAVILRILHKSGDIAVLRALGMEGRHVAKIFTAVGALTGFLGTLLGSLLGLGIIWSLARYQWIPIPKDVYLIKTLPVCISWTASIMVALFSFLLCYGASQLASKRVLELPLTKGLHRP